MLLVVLLINAAFLGVIVYLMGEAVANSAERNKTQLGLIEKLVTDIRDCRQGRAATVTIRRKSRWSTAEGRAMKVVTLRSRR